MPEKRYKCPDGCDAGWTTTGDGRECLGCGAPVVEAEQSGLTSFAGEERGE